MPRPIVVGLNAVILAVTEESPRILTIQLDNLRGLDALPFGPLDPDGDRTLDLGLRKWVAQQTGLHLGYVEQLYTFADRDRESQDSKGARIVSVAYLALVQEDSSPFGSARWRSCYSFFPWEDWRDRKPQVIDREILPHLRAWAGSTNQGWIKRQRLERVEIAFGEAGAAWDEEKVLDRYELLYEAALVSEAHKDSNLAANRPKREDTSVFGRAMAHDHRRIFATAIGRIRAKIKYRPLVFELLPEYFSLFQLQRLVEALAGVRVHKQNFRRLVEKGGLVEGTRRIQGQPRGRPAELFRFRHEVLKERRAPGVGLPEARRH